jgi:hypothetical protein
LEGQRCAFLFGNTAPDVQVISGQPREATHFFRLPVEDNTLPPWELIIRSYPSLAEPGRLPPGQSAFLAGYLCHLLADWLWVKEIYAPVFGPACAWDTFHRRLYLHNILRAYLDNQVLEKLPGGLDGCLEGVSPQGWLPFVPDTPLVKWRSFLSEQLHPGASAQTVEVFAGRQGISPHEFHSLLNSEDRLEAEVFARIPRQRLKAYRRQLLSESLCLVHSYLAHSLAGRAGAGWPVPYAETRMEFRSKFK